MERAEGSYLTLKSKDVTVRAYEGEKGIHNQHVFNITFNIHQNRDLVLIHLILL